MEKISGGLKILQILKYLPATKSQKRQIPPQLKGVIICFGVPKFRDWRPADLVAKNTFYLFY